jgi:hypothetical protein
MFLSTLINYLIRRLDRYYRASAAITESPTQMPYTQSCVCVYLLTEIVFEKCVKSFLV